LYMNPLRNTYHHHLLIAMNALQVMAENDLQEIQKTIDDILSIKSQMEDLAISRGYSQACKNGISTCRGECCKYHYPRDLTSVDFYLAIYNMPVVQQKGLSQLISANDKPYCPMLLDTGCFFSFEQRPIICTHAYPCFIDRSYWMAKESRSGQIKKAFASLSDMISKCTTSSPLT